MFRWVSSPLAIQTQQQRVTVYGLYLYDNKARGFAVWNVLCLGVHDNVCEERPYCIPGKSRDACRKKSVQGNRPPFSPRIHSNAKQEIVCIGPTCQKFRTILDHDHDEYYTRNYSPYSQ
jgi:hypothetical protein